MLPESFIKAVKEIATELAGARTTAQEDEAVRAFLAVCNTYGVTEQVAEKACSRHLA